MTNICLALCKNKKALKALHLLHAMHEENVHAKPYIYDKVLHHVYTYHNTEYLESTYKLYESIYPDGPYVVRNAYEGPLLCDKRVNWLLEGGAKYYDVLESHLVTLVNLYKKDQPEKLRHLFETVVIRLCDLVRYIR